MMTKMKMYEIEMEELVAKYPTNPTYKDIEDFVIEVGSWFEEHYYYPYKYHIIQYVLEKFEERTGIPLYFEKKAISTHSPHWFGWRRSMSGGGLQYCVQGHSGYVNCIVLSKEAVAKMKEVKI